MLILKAKITLYYDGKTYLIEEEYGLNMNEETIEFLWEEGNLCCDCNRANIIRAKIDPTFPKFDCKNHDEENIKLVSIDIEKS